MSIRIRTHREITRFIEKTVTICHVLKIENISVFSLILMTQCVRQGGNI